MRKLNLHEYDSGGKRFNDTSAHAARATCAIRGWSHYVSWSLHREHILWVWIILATVGMNSGRGLGP
jgi:hypothetical protein